MPELVFRIIIAVGLIWITQVLLDALSVREPARNIIFVVVILAAILYLVFGATFLPIR